MAYSLVIEQNDGELLELESSCLLAFVDETGSEDLKDKNYPIFGFGGCCILAGNYLDDIAIPWQQMKSSAYGDSQAFFHASEINPKTERFTEKVEGLNHFFKHGSYTRFAALYEINTKIDKNFESLHSAAISLLRNQIMKAAEFWRPSQIVVIFESCERVDDFLYTHFSSIKSATGTYSDGTSIEIPITAFFATKEMRLDGLEVADCIIHTAGSSYRSALRNGTGVPIDRKDYHAIFGAHIDRHLIDVKFIRAMLLGSNT